MGGLSKDTEKRGTVKLHPNDDIEWPIGASIFALYQSLETSAVRARADLFSEVLSTFVGLRHPDPNDILFSQARLVVAARVTSGYRGPSWSAQRSRYALAIRSYLERSAHWWRLARSMIFKSS